MNLNTTSSIPFNSEAFTPLLPFNEKNFLELAVQSDHAEIAIKTPDNRIINVWNISNPAYHCYFKYGKTPPFHHTHLFVDQPYVNGKMEEHLAKKTQDQITTIAERFVKGEVNVQIIVEGFESFFSDLSKKITSLKHTEFTIFSLLDHKPPHWKSEWNVTGILIDTSRFKIVQQKVYSLKYKEEQDENREKDFDLPVVWLRDLTKEEMIVVAGVHINGCSSQYPKTGLETLANIIKEIREEFFGYYDIIAAGDYNTIPARLRENLIHAPNPSNTNMTSIKIDKKLLIAPYPTHVNPASEAANYDQALIITAKPERCYQILPVESLSKASQGLVQSIQKSRQLFLDENRIDL